jgi:hypothetical protein
MDYRGEYLTLNWYANIFDEDKGIVFKMAFDSYFKNNSEVTDNVYLMLLLVLYNPRKKYSFEYRRIEDNGQKAVWSSSSMTLRKK